MPSEESNERVSASGANSGGESGAFGAGGAGRVGKPLFTWRFKHGVDGQGRIQFPNKWKMRSAEAELIAVVVRHKLVDKDFILVLPYELFERFSAGLLDGPFVEPMELARRHDYSERIMSLDLDGAGRFTLPSELREPTDLRKEALLVGCIDRFEIWNPKDYDAARAAEKVLAKVDSKTL